MLNLNEMTDEIIRTQHTLFSGVHGKGLDDAALAAQTLQTATALVTLNKLGPIIESLGPSYLALMKVLYKGAEAMMNEDDEPEETELDFIGFPTMGGFDS